MGWNVNANSALNDDFLSSGFAALVAQEEIAKEKGLLSISKKFSGWEPIAEVMEVEDLVTCNLEGKVLAGERPPTSEKALHLACLRHHADIGAVMHSHALFATMFAVARQPIPCIVEEFDVYVGGEVRVAEYKLTGSDELGEEVARHVGDRGAVLIANHGLLAVGKHPLDALKVSRRKQKL